jgi:hypothetical protein
VSKLDAIPELQKENAGFWNWLGGQSTARPQGDGPRNARNWNVTMEDGTVVLGNIELKDRAVLLSVNSAARAAQGAAMLQGVLSDIVRAPLTEIQTIDQVRESSADAPPPEEIPLEVATGLVHAMLDKQYRAVLDEPVPMLGDRSPREAARTPAGREKLVTWLKFLENRSGGKTDSTDPMATYDFGWLWRELGVEVLRR